MKRDAATKTTHLLNVDLDNCSRSDLQPLVAAIIDDVFVLYSGRIKGTYHAHLELPGRCTSADASILGFSKLIRTLPNAAANLWNEADHRDFNIGVQSATEPRSHDLALSPEAVRAASELNARILFTVYACGEDAKEPHEEVAAQKKIVKK